jgi:hypothetical protein
MRWFILLTVFTLAGVSAHAQGVARVREELASPAPFTGVSVKVVEQADAARAVAAADRNAGAKKITCYHVSLFRDNSQSAGANARAIVAQFRELFPEVSVELGYETPYFRVVAGTFIDHLDAIALCGKAISTFPKAVVVRSEMEVSSAIARRKAASFVISDEKNTKDIEN